MIIMSVFVKLCKDGCIASIDLGFYVTGHLINIVLLCKKKPDFGDFLYHYSVYSSTT